MLSSHLLPNCLSCVRVLFFIRFFESIRLFVLMCMISTRLKSHARVQNCGPVHAIEQHTVYSTSTFSFNSNSFSHSRSIYFILAFTLSCSRQLISIYIYINVCVCVCAHHPRDTNEHFIVTTPSNIRRKSCETDSAHGFFFLLLLLYV